MCVISFSFSSLFENVVPVEDRRNAMELNLARVDLVIVAYLIEVVVRIMFAILL